MQLDAIDCQGFAGGFTMGAVQAGFRLVAKREHSGGFGVPLVENNRHLLGDQWDVQSCDGSEWQPYQVPFVFGNPPCSGFSTMNDKHPMAGAQVNSCMWDFVGFAARCNPQIMVFESVTNAYRNGRDLMRALREHVEKLTGDRWWLTHVLHNASSVGGACTRRRYFFVCHRIPFGVNHEPVQRAVLHDVIGDLAGLANTFDPQPYIYAPTWWSESRRNGNELVDGCYHPTGDHPRTFDLIDKANGIEWETGDRLVRMMQKYWAVHGDLPESWHGSRAHAKRCSDAPNFKMGFDAFQPVRWSAHEPGRVIEGHSIDRGRVIHPIEDRVITHREALRVMGFPDAWRVGELRNNRALPLMYGKGVTVDCGRWIAGAARASILGEPGELVGESVGDRESLIDLLRAA